MKIKTSVIIPVFNQLKYTKQCLKFLFENTDPPFEVIVINNNSTDGTKEYLESLKDKVITIHNSKNVGYSKSNNQASEIAKGDYLVFLNNDTIVKKGWLSEMIKLAETDEKIAIVGGKILFPQGDIQTVGMVIYQDGTPYELYKNLDPDLPMVNKPREFQCVTGASMLIKKKIFFEIGRFDENFINHFEDIDLCFRARDYGYKVFYCPTSVVIHYSGKTEGRWDHYNHNVKYFYEKWSNYKQDDISYLNYDGYKITFIDGKVTFLKKNPINIIWEGPFFEDRRISITNRQLVKYIIRTGEVDVSLRHKDDLSFIDNIPVIDDKSEDNILLVLEKYDKNKIIKYLNRKIENEFTVTNCLNNLNIIPPYGKWIFWYNIVPNSELNEILKKQRIDEFWVYNSFTKKYLTKMGFDSNKIQIIPPGVEIAQFDIPTQGEDDFSFIDKKFKFLFIGSTSNLDGIDILLETYLKTFSWDDDVCLIIKTREKSSKGELIDMGEWLNQNFNINSQSPKIIYINNDLPYKIIQALYKTCDCYVHPFRYKIAGISIIEAMRFGLPVIVPSQGCCEDFCDNNVSLLVDSEIDKENNWEIKVNKSSLGQKMKYAYENHEFVKQMGKKAQKKVLDFFTWKHSAYKIINRLKVLGNKYKVRIYWYGDPISIPNFNKDWEFINCSSSDFSVYENNDPFIIKINIYEGNPKDIENIKLDLNCFNIGWITEFVDKLTKEQITVFKDFTQLWLMDEQQYNIFREYFSNNELDIKIIPPIVNPDYFNPDFPPLEINEKRKFNFLTIIDDNNNSDDLEFLLNAFLKSFKKYDDVSLIVQLNVKNYDNVVQKFLNIIEKLGYTHDNIPDIIFLNEKFQIDNFSRLYNSVQALILPFYIKGITHRIIEAISCKLPVITKHNILPEFLRKICFVLNDEKDLIEYYNNNLSIQVDKPFTKYNLYNELINNEIKKLVK